MISNNKVWLGIAVLSQGFHQMQISITGSDLEPKHIQRIHNALWADFRNVASSRDSVKRTLDIHDKSGGGSGSKSLKKCLGELEHEVYELEHLLNYTERVLSDVKEVLK